MIWLLTQAGHSDEGCLRILKVAFYYYLRLGVPGIESDGRETWTLR